MLKVAQTAFIGLHGVQFWCSYARSCLRNPICTGKSAIKFARVNGPLFSNLTFKTHLREVVLKAAKSLKVVR